MNTLHSKIAGTFILTIGISLSGWAANPCMPIGMKCMDMGFYKGGDKVGKGLVKDCVMPVVMKTKVLPDTTFSDAVLDACKVDLMAKMKEQTAM